jgi:hypothetical protein
MSKVSMSTIIKATADQVWKIVRDFNGLPAFMEAIAESGTEGRGVGAVRTLTMKDGGPPIVEKLESLDEKARTLTYSIVTSPLPLDAYVATMEVTDLADGQCELKWYSTFQPEGATEEEAMEVVKGVYSMGFDGLKRLFAGS